MGLFRRSTTLELRWREPWLPRLRLHQDLPVRLLLCLVISIAIGSIFAVAGRLEKAGPNAIAGSEFVAATFGFVFMGGIMSVGIIMRPEAMLGGKVRISDDDIRRTRETLDLGNGLSVQERWVCSGLTCAIVPAEALPTPFSVLVLPGERGKSSLIAIPQHIDREEIVGRLRVAGATVVMAPQLAEAVRQQCPYSRRFVTWCVAVGAVVTLACVGFLVFQA